MRGALHDMRNARTRSHSGEKDQRLRNLYRFIIIRAVRAVRGGAAGFERNRAPGDRRELASSGYRVRNRYRFISIPAVAPQM
jgi:hypothetical protein